MLVIIIYMFSRRPHRGQCAWLLPPPFSQPICSPAGVKRRETGRQPEIRTQNNIVSDLCVQVNKSHSKQWITVLWSALVTMLLSPAVFHRCVFGSFRYKCVCESRFSIKDCGVTKAQMWHWCSAASRGASPVCLLSNSCTQPSASPLCSLAFSHSLS